MGFMFFLFDVVSLLIRCMFDGMKCLGIVLWMCMLMGMSVKADNPSLIRMDGRVVGLSEFLWHLNRLGADDVNVYFKQFLMYQLKVADAKRMRLDTLPDFNRQAEFLKARVLKKYFMNGQLADSYYHQLTEELVGLHAEKEWVRMDVFTFRLSQHASDVEEGNAVRVMNAWTKRLNEVGVPGETDLKWAREHGVVRQQDGEDWTPVNRLLKEILYHQEKLQLGCWSEPFESPLGQHVIRVVERSNMVGDDGFPELRRYVEQQAASTTIFNRTAYEEWINGNSQLPAEVAYELVFAYEGLLATYWEQQHQLRRGAHQTVSPASLKAYFRSHKDKYNWEYPHFKGAVIHCLDKKAASKIKKKLKKLPMEQWKETLARLQQENPMYSGELECGLFQIGKNPYVDRLAFKCGNFRPHEKFPYTLLLGKKLKKGPEEYTDVLSEVTTDYLIQRENDQFSQLFARFNVEINKDVLKTVNSCGNK